MNATSFFDFAKTMKDLWCEHCQHKDMPPFVIVEKDGKLLLMVMAPQVDKKMALQAAYLCRKGFACDAVTFVADCYTYRPPSRLPVDVANKLVDEVREKYGSYQEAFQAGEPNVKESLTVIHCNTEDEASLTVATYKTEGDKIEWDEPTTMDSSKDGKLEGYIVESLRKILKESSVLEMKIMQDAAKQLGLDDDDEKQLFHAGRAIRKVLHQENFLVMECIQWSPEDGRDVLRQKMREQYEKIKDIYDLDSMTTSDNFWDEYWPHIN